MKLLNPLHGIAATWDKVQSETGGMPIGGLILVGLVVVAYALAALGLLALVAHMVGAFAEGLRAGWRRSTAKAADEELKREPHA